MPFVHEAIFGSVKRRGRGQKGGVPPFSFSVNTGTVFSVMLCVWTSLVLYTSVQDSFIPGTIRTWNMLPEHTVCSSALVSFSDSLKCFLTSIQLLFLSQSLCIVVDSKIVLFLGTLYYSFLLFVYPLFKFLRLCVCESVGSV